MMHATPGLNAKIQPPHHHRIYETTILGKKIRQTQRILKVEIARKRQTLRFRELMLVLDFTGRFMVLIGILQSESN